MVVVVVERRLENEIRLGERSACVANTHTVWKVSAAGIEHWICGSQMYEVLK